MTTKQKKDLGRAAIGILLLTTGIGHLTFLRKDFQAQVPDWVPLSKDDTVVYSGVAELALGTAMLAAPKKERPLVGKIAAAFFTAIFPGNISQYVNHRYTPGLDSDKKIFARLFLQPVLIALSLWSTKK